MTFDADQYKTTTRQQWEDYAGGWSDWAPLLETLARPGDRAHARPRRGRKRGAGCSTWPPGRRPDASPRHRRVGTDGLGARHRPVPDHPASTPPRAAEAAGLDNVSTRELDGERLDELPGESFDAAISRVGLIYFPNRHQALTGIRRRAARRRTIRHRDLLDAPRPTASSPCRSPIIRERAQLPAPAPGQPGPFSLADPEVLEHDLTEPGSTTSTSR